LNSGYQLPSTTIERLISKYRVLELVDKKGNKVGELHLGENLPINIPSGLIINKWIKDRRREEEFLSDLVKAWFMEDLFGEWLRLHLSKEDPTIVIEGAGADKERKIVLGQIPIGKVTTEADFVVRSQGRSVKIELQYSTEKRKSYDIKDSKIKRAVEEGNVKIIFVIKPTNEYFILDPKWVSETRTPIPNPRWGGKPTYNVKSDEVTYRRIADGISLSMLYS
jgi:hypothetical protein